MTTEHTGEETIGVAHSTDPTIWTKAIGESDDLLDRKPSADVGFAGDADEARIRRVS